MNYKTTSLLTLGTIIAGVAGAVVFTHLWGGAVLFVLAGVCFFIREYFKLNGE